MIFFGEVQPHHINVKVAGKEDDKVKSMWDHYLHEENLENGDIASDHYHRYEEDIRMMQRVVKIHIDFL